MNYKDFVIIDFLDIRFQKAFKKYFKELIVEYERLVSETKTRVKEIDNNDKIKSNTRMG